MVCLSSPESRLPHSSSWSPALGRCPDHPGLPASFPELRSYKWFSTSSVSFKCPTHTVRCPQRSHKLPEDRGRALEFCCVPRAPGRGEELLLGAGAGPDSSRWEYPREKPKALGPGGQEGVLGLPAAGADAQHQWVAEPALWAGSRGPPAHDVSRSPAPTAPRTMYHINLYFLSPYNVDRF